MSLAEAVFEGEDQSLAIRAAISSLASSCAQKQCQRSIKANLETPSGRVLSSILICRLNSVVFHIIGLKTIKQACLII